MRKFYIIVNVLFCIGSITNAAYAKENILIDNTLCTNHELIYFNCSLENRKIVSMCGTPDKSEKIGYVQYRYGTPNNIEMKYPEKLLPAKGNIFYVNESAGSVNSALLFFEKEHYFYTIFDTQGNASLSVTKGRPSYENKSIFFQRCGEYKKIDTKYWVKEYWKDLFQDGKEYYWTGKNKPM